MITIQINASTKQAISSLDELTKAIKINNSKIEKSYSEIIKSIENESKSTQKLEQSVVSLNQQIEGLNQTIEKQTETLDQNTKAIDDNRTILDGLLTSVGLVGTGIDKALSLFVGFASVVSEIPSKAKAAADAYTNLANALLLIGISLPFKKFAENISKMQNAEKEFYEDNTFFVGKILGGYIYLKRELIKQLSAISKAFDPVIAKVRLFAAVVGVTIPTLSDFGDYLDSVFYGRLFNMGNFLDSLVSDFITFAKVIGSAGGVILSFADKIKIVAKYFPGLASTVIGVKKLISDLAVTTAYSTRSLLGIVDVGLLLGASLTSIGILVRDLDQEYAKITGTVLIFTGVALGGLSVAVVQLIGLLGKFLHGVGSQMVSFFIETTKKTNEAARSIFIFDRTINGINEAFGGAVGSAESWDAIIQEISKNTAFTSSETRKAALEISSAGYQLGLTKEQMALLLQISIDYASFAKNDLYETTVNMIQALNGQSQSVIKYGIKLSETSVQHKIYEKGINKTLNAMSDYEKTQARLNVLVDQYKPIAGAAAAVTETLSGQEELLAKNLYEMKIAFGEGASAIENTNIATYAFNTLLGGISKSLLSIIGFVGALAARIIQITGIFVSWSFVIFSVLKGFKLLQIFLNSDIAKSLFVKSIPLVNTSLQQLFKTAGIAGSQLKSLQGIVGALVTVVTTEFKSLLASIAGISASAASFVTIIRALLVKSLRSLAAALGVVSVAFLGFISNPVVALVIGFGVALYGLYQAMVEIEKRTGALSAIWEALTGVLSGGFSVFGKVKDGIDSVTASIKNFFDVASGKIIARLSNGLASATGYLSRFFDKEQSKKLADASTKLKGLANNLEGVGFKLSKLSSDSKRSIAGFAGSFSNFKPEDFYNLDDELKDVGKSALQKLKEVYDKRKGIVDAALAEGLIDTEKYNEIIVKIEADNAEKITEINKRAAEEKKKIQDEQLGKVTEILDKEYKIAEKNGLLTLAAVENIKNKQLETIQKNLEAGVIATEVAARAIIQVEEKAAEASREILEKRKQAMKDYAASVVSTMAGAAASIRSINDSLEEGLKDSGEQLTESLGKAAQDAADNVTAVNISFEADTSKLQRELQSNLEKINADTSAEAAKIESELNVKLSTLVSYNDIVDAYADAEAARQKLAIENQQRIDEIQTSFSENNSELLIKAEEDRQKIAMDLEKQRQSLQDAAEKSRQESIQKAEEDRLKASKEAAFNIIKGGAALAADAYLPGSGQFVGPVVDMLMAGGEAIKQTFAEIFKQIPQIVMALVDAIPYVVEAFDENLPKLAVNLSNKLSDPSFWTRFIANMISALTRSLSTVPQTLINGIKDRFSNLGSFFEKIFDVGKIVVDSIWQALKDAGNFFAKIFKFEGGGKGAVENFLGFDFPWMAFAKGGVVPGWAKVTGDSKLNDIIPALLSPGEVVLPRSVVEGGAGGIISFLENLGIQAEGMAFGGIGKKGFFGKVGGAIGGAFNDVASFVGGVAGDAINNVVGIADILIPGDLQGIYKSLKQFVSDIDIPNFVAHPVSETERLVKGVINLFQPSFKKMLSFGMAEGGMIRSVNGGIAGMDSVPVRLMPGKLVVDRVTTGQLKEYLNTPKQEDNSVTNALLAQIVTLLSKDQNIETEVKVDREVFANIILNLTRSNQRLTA